MLYELGYSLDNLSLMALTIAVGFVVDDAVVVIENIVRHIEEGLTPMQAALKGAGEIGFTIVSITLSLIAVFIPLFLMGGYVGKLFQEFAVTVSVSLVLSLVISLTLTPMMCSRLLKPESRGSMAGSTRISERGFDGAARPSTKRGLKVALRHQFVTLMVMLGTIALTGYLYYMIPKGFFPGAGHRNDPRPSPRRRRIFRFRPWLERQQALPICVLQDPAVDTVGARSAPAAAQRRSINGRVFIALKPHNSTQRERRSR